ncbi:g9696 [Coccomyxa viridis]|uniref:intramembrane prenyl-peptidase Rce1 n=1 Tax=Coccomyxa viridis TaxID=1274662 RepID=A0ABP1G689_9CHLO
MGDTSVDSHHRSSWIDRVLENSVLAALATLLKVLLVPVQLLAIVAKRRREGLMHALLACLLISTAYVAPFYFQRKVPRGHRNTVLFRTVSTLTVCAVAWIPLALAVSRSSKVEDIQGRHVVLQLLGLRTKGLAAAALVPILLTALLFLGPLSLLVIKWLSGRRVEQLDRSLLEWWRSTVVGPVTEEFAFRACMLPLLLLQGYGPTQAVLLTPLFFGVAHLHHAYDFVVHQGCTVHDALLMVGFQAAFTTVFGWYASFLLFRTGHYIAPLGAHAFCNIMGFPDLSAAQAHPRARLISRLYLVGILAFAALVGPLSHPLLYSNMLPSRSLGVNMYGHIAHDACRVP